MNKELQNKKTWSVLPKEFKEEVKKIYQDLTAAYDKYAKEEAWNTTNAIYSKICILREVFGRHNLTSDAEGEEEMLYVKRKWVLEMYKNNCDEIRRENISSSDKDCYEYANEVLKTLFGSKCLPDK